MNGEQLSRGLWSLERCFKEAGEQRGERKGGGRDSRRPTIGSQVIGYFEWSASSVSLPGGS